MKRNLIILSLTAVLSACASSPSVTPQAKHYVLDVFPKTKPQTKPQTEQTSSTKQLIAIKPISVPAYLDQPNLVMRGTDQQLIVANYHSWGDNLADSIRRALRDALNGGEQEYHFVNSCQNCAAIKISIDHFYPSTAGEVYLAGSYQLISAQQETESHKPFSLQRTMQQSGYDEAVKQMQSLIMELSVQLRKTVRQQAAQTE